MLVFGFRECNEARSDLPIDSVEELLREAIEVQEGAAGVRVGKRNLPLPARNARVLGGGRLWKLFCSALRCFSSV
jgi:hypothetical protein